MIQLIACLLITQGPLLADDGADALATAAQNHARTMESFDSWTGTMLIVHMTGTNSEFPSCPIARNDKPLAKVLFATGHGALKRIVKTQFDIDRKNNRLLVLQKPVGHSSYIDSTSESDIAIASKSRPLTCLEHVRTSEDYIRFEYEHTKAFPEPNPLFDGVDQYRSVTRDKPNAAERESTWELFNPEDLLRGGGRHSISRLLSIASENYDILQNPKSSWTNVDECVISGEMASGDTVEYVLRRHDGVMLLHSYKIDCGQGTSFSTSWDYVTVDDHVVPSFYLRQHHSKGSIGWSHAASVKTASINRPSDSDFDYSDLSIREGDTLFDKETKAHFIFKDGVPVKKR